MEGLVLSDAYTQEQVWQVIRHALRYDLGAHSEAQAVGLCWSEPTLADVRYLLQACQQLCLLVHTRRLLQQLLRGLRLLLHASWYALRSVGGGCNC